jgi:organic hydroperoxide reductase OsmC/OhrA
MAKPFPHRYRVDLKWNGGVDGTLSSPSLPDVVGGPPPEFDGPGGLWSPEHLLVSSVNLCLMSTFQAIARHSNLAVKSYEAHGEGVVEKTERWILFTAVNLQVNVKVAAADVPKAEKALAKAKEHCIVSNALKFPVNLEATVLAA